MHFLTILNYSLGNNSYVTGMVDLYLTISTNNKTTHIFINNYFTGVITEIPYIICKMIIVIGVVNRIVKFNCNVCFTMCHIYNYLNIFIFVKVIKAVLTIRKDFSKLTINKVCRIYRNGNPLSCFNISSSNFVFNIL